MVRNSPHYPASWGCRPRCREKGARPRPLVFGPDEVVMNRRVLRESLTLYRRLNPSDMISPLLLTRITWKDRSFCIKRPVERLGMILKISSPTPEALANPTPGRIRRDNGRWPDFAC